MTPVHISLAGWIWAASISAGAALLTMWAWSASRPRRREITTDPEPVSTAPFTPHRTMPMRLVSRWWNAGGRHTPTSPGRAAGAVAVPVAHAGADAGYAATLRQMRDMPVPDELAPAPTPADTHEWFAPLLTAEWEFTTRTLDAIAAFVARAEPREELRLLRSLDDTCEMKAVTA